MDGAINTLSKLSTAELKDFWRLTVHWNREAAQAIDFELSERIGAELEASMYAAEAA